MTYKTMFHSVKLKSNYKIQFYNRKLMISEVRLNKKFVQTYPMLSGKENNTLLIFLMKILFRKTYTYKSEAYTNKC